MIVGVGLDLVEVSHFRRIIQKGGVAFYKKILTPAEFKEAEALSPSAQVGYGARHYAVKEAFAKACGTGLGKFVGLKDVALTHDGEGAPILKMNKKMTARLQHKFGDNVKVTVSLADDKIAGAVVILSRD